GPALPDLAEDLAGAADLAAVEILEHHQIQLVRRIFLVAGETRLGAFEPGAERLFVGGQVGEAAAGQLRHFIDALQIARPGRSDHMIHSAPRSAILVMVSADNCARSARLSVIRNSSAEWIAPPRGPMVSTTGM